MHEQYDEIVSLFISKSAAKNIAEDVQLSQDITENFNSFTEERQDGCIRYISEIISFKGQSLLVKYLKNKQYWNKVWEHKAL